MSAILSTDDLNDFIAPGVACVKPIETLPAAPPPSSLETEVILDGDSRSATASTAPPAEISLTDCLACSGCVTSAEAVLVSLQSHAEVLATLDAAPSLRVVGPDPSSGRYAVLGLEDENAKLLVASVSPQTRASLAAACGPGVSAAQAGAMLDTLLLDGGALTRSGRHASGGFAWVVDTNAAREMTHVLSAEEVLGSSSSPSLTATAPAKKPILASSCPGWVCYAEKTHPHVLPHLSRVKSPQALTGTLLKTTLSAALGIPPSRIWHLAVMPCFDKKLEASREELTDEVWARSGRPGRGVRDVDCVITSKEVLMLAESRGLDFFKLSREARPPVMAPFPDPTLQKFLFRQPSPSPAVSKTTPLAAGSSGGLLYHILQSRAAQTPGAEIQVIKGRNADVVEYVVSVDGEPVFKAARYYGFRNIQNLVRRLKPARPSKMPGGKPFGSARRPTGGKSASLEHSYIEVMACPGGCTNGGGQIKVDDTVVMERKQLSDKPGPQEQKEWLAEVDEAYFSGDDEAAVEDGPAAGDVVLGVSHSYINDTLAYWSDMTGIDLRRLAFTTYREVISDVGKASEGERVIQLAGKIGGGW
ncbi:Iron hydrogenase [Cordyceps fumosorosea ARSEF 2679]|uniref:Nuclear architecture-related protein 1 n=1 Tax=Cordyceps fumosorosea (strain ARSEF 2679) TaxID=1081104 RepID=A0A168E2J2_CORFA|nr:Iron hydrogenase [Cordyceps fumosorosea ARSEF 2679]OAA73301.1 Iron hydrogenase [Cordyceps fumosorosea ARSEF 2679]